jgi:F0F1-type ATP synthase membrane subunit c/vacuolar-type H+-ATPase subunit K
MNQRFETVGLMRRIAGDRWMERFSEGPEEQLPVQMQAILALTAAIACWGLIGAVLYLGFSALRNALGPLSSLIA